MLSQPMERAALLNESHPTAVDSRAESELLDDLAKELPVGLSDLPPKTASREATAKPHFFTCKKYE
jgi:hypothetical protein